MASGNYVYVQKRIVLKHPACINFEPKSMSAILTDRAKSDQASYCLGIIKHKDGSIELSLPEKHKKFTRHGLGSTLWNSHFGDQMSRFLADNGSDLPPILSLDFDDGDGKPEHGGGGGGNPPDDPINWLEVILKTYLKKRNLSEDQAAALFDAKGVTIHRMWDEPDSHTKFRNAVGVCIALRIPSGTSEQVIQLCGYYLRDTKQEHHVKALIQVINEETTMEGCNQYLAEHDCVPIQYMK